MGESPNPPQNAEINSAVVRWFLQNSDSGFIAVRDGLISFISPSWETMTGWTPAEVIGRPVRDFTHPDEPEIERKVLRDLLETGKAECEQRIRANTGRWLHVRSKVTVGPGDLTLITAQDVTELRREAEERRAAERANEMLRETIGVLSWRFDPLTRHYHLDQNARRLSDDGEYVTRDVSADEMTAVIHPDDIERMNAALLTTIQTGATQVIDYRHFVEDRGVWARYRANWRGGRLLPGGLWEVIGITQDVTELADARDAALAAAEAKSQFLANMSHEIRTPMNGVLGVLHLLGSENLSPDGRRLLDEASGCGRMLAELLNDIIDFSRIEAGRLDLSPEPVDPAALLESVAGLIRPQAQDQGLTLTVSSDPDIGWKSLDPVRLRQMLFNLIGNAVKFTQSGGVQVRLRRPSPGQLRFEIEDTGMGIPEEAQADLFQRFTQADGSTTRRFGGSGLGLAITRLLAELMDGEVGFHSRPGEGSLFWFTIAAPSAMPAAPVEEAEASSPLLDGLRVLVVEDNPTNRLIATRLLEQLGANVETAEDGRQGLEVAARGEYDLIFMDIQMPVMDGLEATRRIRALPGPVGETPIVAMTANAMAHQKASYLEAGMTGVVAKPLSPAALVAQIVAVATREPAGATA